MLKKHLSAALFALGLLALASGANAQLYKWVDEQGVVHYSQTPPAEESEEINDYPVGEGEESIAEEQFFDDVAPIPEAEPYEEVAPLDGAVEETLTVSEVEEMDSSLTEEESAVAEAEEEAEEELPAVPPSAKDPEECAKVTTNLANLRQFARITVDDPVTGERRFMDEGERQSTLVEMVELEGIFCE